MSASSIYQPISDLGYKIQNESYSETQNPV